MHRSEPFVAMDAFDKQLLNRLQKGLLLVPRPFEALGQELGMGEAETLERVRRLKARGVIRRLGGIFDSRNLGFQSTLIALQVPEERVEEAAAVINAYPEVTHHYLRDHERYNLWFTLIASSEARVQEILEEISRRVAPAAIRNLPAKRLFKIQVDFSL